MWKKPNSCLNCMKTLNQKVSFVVVVVVVVNHICEHELRSKTVGVNLVRRLTTRFIRLGVSFL